MNARSLPSIHLPYALGLILMLQAALTFLDPTPRYLNEDSASYLWSVFAGGPFDRSWTYPAWFLRPLFLLHSIHPVVYVQCALGVIPAWLALRIVSGPSGRDCSLVALATAILCLIEPLALTYQRFILADSLGLVMAATALFLCVRVIDRSPRAPVYAVLAPPFIVLAASLRGSQIPSLALLCALVLILLFVFHRDYRSGAAMLASLVLCQAVFSHYALQHQGTAGYNASSGQFMLAAVLPIVSRDDVERYIDPARIPAILDDNARNPRARPGELFERGKTADQIHQASKSLKDESRLAGRIATHAILRNPIGLLGLAWSSYLDYFDERYMHNRILIEQGMRNFEPNELANLADHEIHGVANNVDLESPVRTYFKAGWRYYGLIPAISAILLAAALIVDRRLSTLTLAGFALASAASHVAFSTEPVPRYLVATAWANIVAAGSIASVLAAGPVEFPAGARAAIAWVNANARLLKPLDRPPAWGACFVAGFAIVASWFSTDGTFDFANYHLYNGFAFFHDRKGLDIFPAHLQTAFYYGTDTVYYVIFTSLNNHPYLINLLLSIPYAAAALAVFIIARMFAEPGFRLPILVSLAVVIFGFSGASTYATFLTTQSDMFPGLAALVALAVWLALERSERNSVWTVLALGGLAGVSVGLKLTQAPMFVGMAVAIAARFATGRRSALREAFVFGLAGLVVFVALDGAWLWSNFNAYGNPIFPVMNNVFKSDLIDFGRWTDQRFLPKSARMALFYPAYWAFHPSSDVSELLMRDPRILLGCMSALIILLGFLWRWRRDRSAPPIGSPESLGFSLAIVFLVSYALWEKVWSIYRYLPVQESLSGVLVLAALPILFGARGRPWLMSALFALVFVMTWRATINPDWDRVPRGPVAVSVQLPPLESNAMVLFLDDTPYGFLVPWMPQTARAVGVNNNLVHPHSSGRLWSVIEAAVHDHEGPLWGLEDPPSHPGDADNSLLSLGLARDGDCVRLDTNMEIGGHAKVCKLRRVATP